MKPSPKSLSVFFAVWLLSLITGYWYGCEPAFGASAGTCGECYFCAQYYEIVNFDIVWGKQYLGWTFKGVVGAWTWQGFNGIGCGLTGGDLYYLGLNAQCLEGGCTGANGNTLEKYFFASADVCTVNNPNLGPGDIIEADNGAGPVSASLFPAQNECGEGGGGGGGT